MDVKDLVMLDKKFQILKRNVLDRTFMDYFVGGCFKFFKFIFIFLLTFSFVVTLSIFLSGQITELEFFFASTFIFFFFFIPIIPLAFYNKVIKFLNNDNLNFENYFYNSLPEKIKFRKRRMIKVVVKSLTRDEEYLLEYKFMNKDVNFEERFNEVIIEEIKNFTEDDFHYLLEHVEGVNVREKLLEGLHNITKARKIPFESVFSNQKNEVINKK